MAQKYSVYEQEVPFITYDDLPGVGDAVDPQTVQNIVQYVRNGLNDLSLRADRNMAEVEKAIQAIQIYENATGAPANDLLSGVVADERLGAQVAGFKRASTGYDFFGSERTIHLPRYPYTRVPYPIWQDNFSVDQLTQEYTSGGDTPATYSASAGVLTITGGIQATLIKNNLILQDVKIEINSNNVYNGGIIARYQDNNNYYLLALRDDSGYEGGIKNLEIYKRVNGSFTSLGYANVIWVNGTNKPIKFTLHGSRLEAWFGGVKVISVTDTNFTSGGVGLRNGTAATTFSVLDFTVYQAVQGVLMEDGCANLLTANQASVETDTTGFTAGAGATITRVTTDYWHGSACLKVDCPAGTFGTYVNNTTVTGVAGDKFTFSFRHKNPGMIGLVIYENGTTKASSSFIPVASTWTKTELTVTLTATNPTIKVEIYNTSGAIQTIYIDGLQLEKLPYATQWQLPGSARVAEVMTVPTAGVFVKGDWAVELTFTPTSVQNVTDNVLWKCYIDASNYYVMGTNTSGYAYLTVCSGGTAVAVINDAALTVDTPYRIMVSGVNNYLYLCINGELIGDTTPYTEPAGTLPVNMYLGSDQSGAYQANGIISDVRIGTSRKAQQHALAYFTGQPLPVDEGTTLKMDFAGTLRQTTRQRLLRNADAFTIADTATTQDSSKATHVVPSGWTSSQSTFLQAIDELPAGGGKISVSEGVYIIDGSIVLPSYVALDGQGSNTVIKIKNSLNANINVITNADPTGGNSGITVSNLKIDGNKANQTAYPTQRGVYFVKVTNSKVMFLNVINLYTSGIHMYTDNTDNTITGNTCQGNKYGMTMGGFCYGNTITGNTCQGNEYGMTMGNPGGSCNGNTITGNTCQGNTLLGMWIIASNDNTVSGNTCQGNVNNGINLSNLCKNNVVVGNTCQGNDRHGIYVEYSNDNTITGNACIENSQVANNTYDDISIVEGSSYNSVTNNTCRKGALTNAPRYGIRIDSSYCNGNLINGNDCYTGGVTAGISDAGTSSNFGSGNRLNDGTWGITAG